MAAERAYSSKFEPGEAQNVVGQMPQTVALTFEGFKVSVEGGRDRGVE